MNTVKAFALASAVAFASISGAAHAQFAASDSTILTPASRYATSQVATSGLTREQVRAEIEQARRDGTLATDYVTGKPFFAVDASVAQRQVATSGKTRAEVKAEVAQALREGTLTVSDITGKPFYGVATRVPARATGAE